MLISQSYKLEELVSKKIFLDKLNKFLESLKKLKKLSKKSVHF